MSDVIEILALRANNTTYVALYTVADVPAPTASNDSSIRPGMNAMAGTEASRINVLILCNIFILSEPIFNLVFSPCCVRYLLFLFSCVRV